MKRPVEVAEMRFGDLIRWESTNSEACREFRVTDPNSRPSKPGNYFLLDRPAPAVELPTEPTLGWADFDGLGRVIGIWESYRPRILNTECAEVLLSREREEVAEHVTAFTPATAIPTEALNKMRRVAATCDATYPDYKEAVFAFLAAVDAANGGAA